MNATPIPPQTHDGEPRIPKRKIYAWALWDWATQPFNTVLLTFVWVPSFLTSYFFLDPDLAASGIQPDGGRLNCDGGENALTEYCGGLGRLATELGWGITIAGLLIALLAPVLGQRADAAGRKKTMLTVFTGLLVLAQLGMFFVDGVPALFWLGVTLIAAGSVFGEIAAVNYYALIVTVSTKRTVGRVSGLGWGFGYIGGIFALALVVAAIFTGVLDGEDPMTFQIVALGAAIWTVAFSIPVLVAIPEPPATPDSRKVNFFAGYVELVRTIVRLWRESRHTVWFLAASAVYRDGLSAVFTFGAVIAGQVFGFGFTDLVIFGIVLNLVAGVSTIFAGRLDDRFGPKPVILVSVGGLVACCLTVFFGAGGGTPVIWAVGIVLAALVGPAQAASRSFLVRVTPEGREGELFGLYATTGRAAGWMASALWAVFIAAFADQTLYGILGIALVLAVGFVLLLFVRAPERERPSIS
ncbi:MFS transporter [uncultured Agrococcus sp.]|uniref:MFS transporter n=1 Tax=uncultured Agrococcus sp. TaxID=382258 RepID=UPI0025DC46BB|nr:MFS transporter [uncultured Agrococcus sp.]